MVLKNFAYNIQLPFRNLTKQSRALQIFRLFTSIGALLFIIFSLVGPLLSTNVYIARINCAHLDVSYGLYKSLRNSVSLTPSILDDSSTNEFPVDSSLTNSEISILTEYAESQVATAPQYIITSLWSWCYGNYNTTEIKDGHGHTRLTRHDDSLVCSKGQSGYVFDYRAELKSIGLSSILAYAFQSNNADDKSYAQLVHGRHNKYKVIAPILVFGGATQFLILVFSLILYSNRGSEKDLSKIPSFLLVILSVIAISSFLGVAVGVGLITRLITVIRDEISTTLGDFGVNLHLGNIWFSLIWLSFSFTLMAMISWVFPLWCANPPDDEDFEYEFDESYYNHHNVSASSNDKTPRFSHKEGKSMALSENYTIPLYKGHRKRTSGARNLQEILNKDDNDDHNSIQLISRNESIRSHRTTQSNKSHKNHIRPSSVNSFHDNYQYTDQDVIPDDDEGDDDIDLEITNELYKHKPKVNMNHFSNDYYYKDEEELRRLGESLSRKSSVRHLYKKSKTSKLDLLPEEETKILLYNDAAILDHQYPRSNHHYREETYDGYVNANENSSGSNFNTANNSRSNSYKNKNRSRSNSARSFNKRSRSNSVNHDLFTQNDIEKTDSKRGATSDNLTHNKSFSFQDRHFQHNPNNNPFLSFNDAKPENQASNKKSDNRFSLNDSLLNDDEMDLLDLNEFINQLNK